VQFCSSEKSPNRNPPRASQLGTKKEFFHLPDKILVIIFGTLSAVSLAVAAICLYFAIKSAKKPEGEIKMALWSFGALAGLVFAGMCFAYFLIPIILNHLFPK